MRSLSRRSSKSPKEAARSYFDRWAPRCEADRLSRWLLESQQEALATLRLRPDDRFLDVGCGSGAAVRRAADLVERAVGLDLSPAMIARADELAKGIPNVEFRQGDSERLPFADGEFTALLCTTSFHHYPNPGQAVHEMARVLSPGGRVVIGDPSADLLVARLADILLRRLEPGHIRLYRSAEIEQLLTDAGLREPTVVRRLRRGSYAIVRARKDRDSSA